MRRRVCLVLYVLGFCFNRAAFAQDQGQIAGLINSFVSTMSQDRPISLSIAKRNGCIPRQRDRYREEALYSFLDFWFPAGSRFGFEGLGPRYFAGISSMANAALAN